MKNVNVCSEYDTENHTEKPEYHWKLRDNRIWVTLKISVGYKGLTFLDNNVGL